MRFTAALRKSTLALLLIAAVAVAQCLLFAQIVESQRDGAHIIDISGAQRMRSQEISYYLATAHYGHGEPHWRDEVERSIGQSLAVRREIRRSPRYASGPRGSDGQTALSRQLDRFFVAARVLEHDPADGDAFSTVRDLRPELLLGLNNAVELRTKVITERSQSLAAALFIGLGIQLLTIFVVWSQLIVPAERRVRRSLAQVSAQRSDMQSFFDQNPDAIVVYDTNGYLVQANAARVDLLGIPAAELVGRHHTSFIAPEVLASAQAAFDRANGGEKVAIETRFTNAAGDLVDVAVRLFPNVIDGRHAGVITVSRDIGELRKAQALSEEMSQRLAALYEIASTHGGSWKQQIREALALAAGQLECEWGGVSEIIGDTVNVLALVGDPVGIAPSASIPLKDTLAQFIIRSDDVWEVDDLRESPWRDHNAQQGTAWVSVVGMKLSVDGVTYGSLLLANSKPRKTPLRSADRDFLKIVAALLGTIINRGQQDTKLDSLAFFDPLTGLANRALISEKLDEMVSAARRHNMEFAVHFLDLDKFKDINDVAGHAAGDEVLRVAAQRFSQCVRSTDTVARLGGDEFIILQPTRNGRQGALELADRVVRAIEEPFILNGTAYTLGCSIGISLFPEDGSDAQTLLRYADKAMYQAKTAKGSRPEFAA